MQRARIHTTCSECNISDLAILLRGLNFAKCLNGSRELHRYSMFTDESHFNRDGVNNTRNSHVWADDNPHATVESNFQQRFSV